MNELDSTGIPPAPQKPASPREATIRGQLLWASAFPLGTFILLSVLMVTTIFRQLTLTLALQRNTAIIQVAADDLLKAIQGGSTTRNLTMILQPLVDENVGSFYWVDSDGKPIGSTDLWAAYYPLEKILSENTDQKSESRLIQIPSGGDEAIVSYAPLPNGAGNLILVEPWGKVMAPTSYYQAILIALLVLGMFFSLYTLSLGIGRVIHPIAELVDIARRAVPGSLFRPMPEQGPAELRALIKAFNQMVVQLAGQQASLRQYAHRALLSQEQERERLSHELHDGTMQDLVGLVQRVELCRSEMDRDPLLARRRLDELQGLLETILGDVRRISNALRPSILEDLGLAAALQTLCNDLERQMPPTQCHCLVTGQERRLSPDLELAVFRVVQEALSNIRKYARQATNVEVNLVFLEGVIEALIHNDGPAFPSPDIRALVRGGHLGLAGMYERARLFHGELILTSDPTAGTTVHLRLPCPSDATEA